MILYNLTMKNKYLLLTLLLTILATNPAHCGSEMAGDIYTMVNLNQNAPVCDGGTCTARGADGSTLTVKANSLAEAQVKIEAFQARNGGKYQPTEWVSADGSMKWTPPPQTHALGNNARH